MAGAGFNIGFGQGPKILNAATGKYGILAPSARFVYTPGGGSAAKVKWNPGYGMHSYDSLYNGSAVSTAEIADLNGYSNIKHYMINPRWQALEPTTLGVYDWSVIDNTLTSLAAVDHPVKLWILVVPGNYNGGAGSVTDGWATSFLPTYILSNPAYGASPTGTSYGWYGGHGNGNTAAAALWRTAVMNRYIALHQAMAARYDGDSRVEGIVFIETSFVIGAGSTNGCPDYVGNAGDTAFIARVGDFTSSVVTAFKSTNVAVANTWLYGSTASQQLTANFLSARCMASTADTYGQTKVSDLSQLDPGIQAYMGRVAVEQSSAWAGGQDYRPIIPFVADIQGPDEGAGGAGYYDPLDVISALKGTYKAGYAFVTRLVSGEGQPSEWNWSNAAPVFNNPANALTNTAYPSNYP